MRRSVRSLALLGLIAFSLAAACGDDGTSTPAPPGNNNGMDMSVSDLGIGDAGEADAAQDLAGDAEKLVGEPVVCVLNEEAPDGECAESGALQFDLVAVGDAPTRLFAVNNEGGAPVEITSAAFDVDSELASFQAVQFEVSTNDPSGFLRTEIDLPVSVAAGESVYFEVAIQGAAGTMFPVSEIVVTADEGASSEQALAVSIEGLFDSCPMDTADCDADPLTCETDTLTSLNHCGQCDQPCLVTNGSEACSAGICEATACDQDYADCDMDPLTCEANTQTSLDHCGGCDQPCDVTNGTETCNAGTCERTACDAGFEDCDMDPLTCEAELATDPTNCGSCGNDCSLPGSVVECVNEMCGFVECQPDNYDIDNDTSNGCEYACVQTATDLPDVDPDNIFDDADCDGIDGDIDLAVFVSRFGFDMNPGTMSQPKRTISAGIAAVVADPTKAYVLVTSGAFGAIELSNSVSIYGGYDHFTWQRDNSNVTEVLGTTGSFQDPIIAISGSNITSRTEFDRVDVSTDNARPFRSAYGVHCDTCPGLAISNADISAGDGGNGVSVNMGSNGQPGLDGDPGLAGSCDGDGVRTGGGGGISRCGASSGGKGGDGGGPQCACNGAAGDAGMTNDVAVIPGAGGSSGVGGGDNCNLLCGSCDPVGDGSNGSPGGDGAIGGNGAAPTTSGSVVGGYWEISSGETGDAGQVGAGGGGGGGGGGEGGTCVNNGSGNGGGGGGGGGCPGSGGGPGLSGGGSFGIFVLNSDGIEILNSTVTSGNGGDGGNGDAGGIGGAGGLGGEGATTCISEVGAGGDGGAGGKGGDGGYGGPGAGGPSFAIYRVNTTVDTTTLTLSFGSGGAGGTSPTVTGPVGPTGDIN